MFPNTPTRSVTGSGRESIREICRQGRHAFKRGSDCSVTRRGDAVQYVDVFLCRMKLLEFSDDAVLAAVPQSPASVRLRDVMQRLGAPRTARGQIKALPSGAAASMSRRTVGSLTALASAKRPSTAGLKDASSATAEPDITITNQTIQCIRTSHWRRRNWYDCLDARIPSVDPGPSGRSSLQRDTAERCRWARVAPLPGLVHRMDRTG